MWEGARYWGAGQIFVSNSTDLTKWTAGVPFISRTLWGNPNVEAGPPPLKLSTGDWVCNHDITHAHAHAHRIRRSHDETRHTQTCTHVKTDRHTRAHAPARPHARTHACQGTLAGILPQLMERAVPGSPRVRLCRLTVVTFIRPIQLFIHLSITPVCPSYPLPHPSVNGSA